MEEYELEHFLNFETFILYKLNDELKTNIFYQDHIKDDLVNTLKISNSGIGIEDKYKILLNSN